MILAIVIFYVTCLGLARVCTPPEGGRLALLRPFSPLLLRPPIPGNIQLPQMAKQLNWARLLSMASDAAKGMLFLHTRSPAIVHRDLKSANLLVDALWHVKVADFNLSRALDQASALSTVNVTNPRWLAPEVLAGGFAGLPADVWSFGTVLWEFMTWQLPFENHNPYQVGGGVGCGWGEGGPPACACAAWGCTAAARRQRCWAGM